MTGRLIATRENILDNPRRTCARLQVPPILENGKAEDRDGH